MRIGKSIAAYEEWLTAELDGDVACADLDQKHRKMGESRLAFLRATYWRWAEEILTACPELKEAPEVLSVGDTHIENFGTWRDAEGRLVWGVNDYDEAARMPCPLDLVRLAASAALSKVKGVSLDEICSHLLAGYKTGLVAPGATILERNEGDNGTLRRRLRVTDTIRDKFWDKLDPAKNATDEPPPGKFARALKSARPERGTKLAYWPRTAGTGSLGRPRWIGFGTWRGAPLVREAKAMVASGWVRAHGKKQRLRCKDAAWGRYRAPDPWYALRDSILVRRLSPNNRKIELDEEAGPSALVNPLMLGAMGRDLAAIHLDDANAHEAITADRWLQPRRFRRSVERALAFTEGDFADWKRQPG